MNELEVALPLEALQALAHGAELSFSLDDETRISLRCNDEALATVRNAVQQALLNMLPAGPNLH